MAIKTEKIVCKFFGDFKVGDNVVRNSDVLCKLSQLNEDGAFNKLMLIQAGSIMEAALAEIIYRAQHFNREGVPNISEADRAAIAKKEIERFKALIDVMKKYKILDGLGAGIYDELDKLRKYRNRVHIQNDTEVEGAPHEEDKAFDDAIVNWALAFNVRVLKHLNKRFPDRKSWSNMPTSSTYQVRRPYSYSSLKGCNGIFSETKMIVRCGCPGILSL
jgi:hypothetical protein